MKLLQSIRKNSKIWNYLNQVGFKKTKYVIQGLAYSYGCVLQSLNCFDVIEIKPVRKIFNEKSQKENIWLVRIPQLNIFKYIKTTELYKLVSDSLPKLTYCLQTEFKDADNNTWVLLQNHAPNSISYTIKCGNFSTCFIPVFCDFTLYFDYSEKAKEIPIEIKEKIKHHYFNEEIKKLVEQIKG